MKFGYDIDPRHRPPRNAPADVAELIGKAPLACRGWPSRLPEHPANQEHLGPGSITTVGPEN
jgi:hypothetical protein